MIQGVREVFEIVDLDDGKNQNPDGGADQVGKIVLIGRGLDQVGFDRSLKWFLEKEQS